MTNGSTRGEAADRARHPGRGLALALLLALGSGLPAPGASAAGDPTTLVRTVDTSLYSPPSPDPMGIAWVDHLGHLLMSDSEVDEMPALFTGQNLFEIDPLTGALLGTSTSVAFSNEPAGMTYDPESHHLYVSDDNRREVFEVDPGPDALYGTDDDAIGSFDTLVFGSRDPEGVAFDRLQGFLYVVDGEGAEVFEVDPGPNAIFDGVPPTGDDSVRSFDTAGFGAIDPEGITYDWENGYLYLIGNDNETIFHVTTGGDVVRTLDYAGVGAENASDLAFGPSSADPSVYSLYVVDRNVDNDTDPGENDGRLYEIAFPAITPGNAPPSIQAGPDRTVELPAGLLLDGTVADDGLPGPLPAVLWSHASGAGSVIFGDPTLEDTTASFSTAGTYVLYLSADDGELSARDEITVVVTGSQGESIVEIPVSASSDDAEEETGGAMKLSSTDLELGTQAGIGQSVGMRFEGVPLTPGSSVLNSYIQFQVDETSSEPTPLTLEGEAADDALPFLDDTGDISERPRTAAQVSWNPVPWETAGESGPAQRSSNLAPIVQEIVDRPGWSAGHSLAILVHGQSGVRTAESSDGVFPPKLRLEFVPNALPAVSILQPADGASVFAGHSVSFGASASDAEDGDLAADLVWSSDLDGPIGTGAAFDLSTLSPGAHAITAEVADAGGARAEDQILVSVLANTPPTVAIAAPADGASAFEGVALAFAASAGDAEEGDLSENLSWSSDLDGPIGTGPGFVTSSLSPGAHQITASLSDSGGLGGADQIGLQVLANTPPSVSIAAPADGSSAFAGQVVGFAASASDAEEGDLSTAIQWSSDRDGPIGTGAGFALSSLSVGSHAISASVADAGGLGGADQIGLQVLANTPPSVSIAAPADGSSAFAGQVVGFAASAADAEEGDLSANIEWTSDLDGFIGASGAFATSSLSPGVHSLRARVADSGGLEGSDQIALTVLEAHPVPALPGWGLGIAGAGLLLAARGLLPGRAQSRRSTSRTSEKGSAAARPTRLPQ